MKLKPLDLFILFLLSIILIIDSLNGIIIRELNLDVSISQIFKITLLGLMIPRILIKKPLGFVILLFIFSIFLIPIITNLIRFGFDALLMDISMLMRLLLFPISLLYFISLFNSNEDLYFKKKSKIISISFWVIVLNILLGSIGIGYAQYSQKFGTVGFFYAGNEVSAIMIIIFSLFLGEKFKYSSKTTFYSLSLLVLVVAALKVTKVALIGTILIVILIPYFAAGKSIFTLTKKRLNFFLLITSISPFIFILLYKVLKSTGIFNRLEYFYNKLDLMSFIFSSRNVILNDAINVYLYDYNLYQKLFGAGPSGFKYNMIGKFKETSSVEMDFFDLLMHFGLFGFTIYFVLFIYIFWVNLRKVKLNFNYKILLIINILLLTVSSVAGHVFYSAMVGFFYALALSILFREKKVILSR